MGKKTYGKMPVSGHVQATGGSVSDPFGKPGISLPGISLWQHSIVLDGGSGIRCQLCDKEEDVPDLLSMSSGFREVVYKMYILGQFKQDSCNPNPQDIEDIRRKAIEYLNKN